MKNKKYIIPCIACLFPIVVGLYLYNDLPSKLAIHWDSAGNVDNLIDKNLVIFVLPLFMAGLLLFLNSALSKPKAAGARSSTLYNLLINWLLPILSNVFMYISYMNAMGYDMNMSILIVIIGILFIIIGNYLPKVRQNRLLGIKTPWALEDEMVWNKTHHLGGYLFLLTGAIYLVCAVLSFSGYKSYMIYIPLVSTILLITILVLYSYIIKRSIH
ncbi:SdpI family protein [Breznakia pachnodae]|uniref:Membrane protein n=1 Tax=Breznakia pachnodae TaxID=265178 RepID=A0ABU0E5M3_9FIRM|nr:SdpI family protein [Breznakia pachnodae]MDQ0362188.1 putative membrane protein [Breznakia pachnodae]